MIPIVASTAQWFKTQSDDDWVLKNQGEGGDYCLFGDQAGTDDDGYAGYLVRIKPADTIEGGVHTEQGVLDSLVFSP